MADDDLTDQGTFEQGSINAGNNWNAGDHRVVNADGTISGKDESYAARENAALLAKKPVHPHAPTEKGIRDAEVTRQGNTAKDMAHEDADQQRADIHNVEEKRKEGRIGAHAAATEIRELQADIQNDKALWRIGDTSEKAQLGAVEAGRPIPANSTLAALAHADAIMLRTQEKDNTAAAAAGEIPAAEATAANVVLNQGIKADRVLEHGKESAATQTLADRVVGIATQTPSTAAEPFFPPPVIPPAPISALLAGDFNNAPVFPSPTEVKTHHAATVAAHPTTATHSATPATPTQSQPAEALTHIAGDAAQSAKHWAADIDQRLAALGNTFDLRANAILHPAPIMSPDMITPPATDISPKPDAAHDAVLALKATGSLPVGNLHADMPTFNDAPVVTRPTITVPKPSIPSGGQGM